MGKKAPQLTALPGQRSIASMFSNPRISSAGGSANGRAVPLLEFLNRKSEKRGSLQGCVADAGLTLAVRERLDAIRKNDPRSQRPAPECQFSVMDVLRSPKQDERGDGTGQVSDDEFTASCYPEETTASKRWSGPQFRAERDESTQDMAAESAGCEPPGRDDWEAHLRSKKAPEARVVDFIDLTEEGDSAGGGCDGEVDVLEEISEISRKRKRSHVDMATMQTCPVCNELFPREMLQAHVEFELDNLEKLKADPVTQAQESMRREGGSACGDKGRFPERSLQFKASGIPTRPRPSALVLGDEPRHRTRADVRHKDKRPSSTFNHYADGRGWWDEGGVGVDAEAVGSASVWEGRGSMSFGGTL